jgi:hypothetical protein
MLASIMLVVAYEGLKANNLPAFQFRFNGFINAEMIYDTRQMVSAREGNVTLWPTPVNKDAAGNDLNANPSLTFSVLSTRLSTTVTGPDVMGAKASGMVEIDFLGTTQPTYSLIRLRHALVRLNWEKSELLAGQYWHPLFIPQCFPGTVSFGAGTPYHILNRGPQLRFTHNTGLLSLAAMLVSQNDYASLGPSGMSTTYLRNSGKPELFGQLIVDKGNFLAGASAGIKWIRPYTLSSMGYQTKEDLTGYSGNVFAKWQHSSFTAKAQVIYGNDLSHHVMLGGYGEAELIDSQRGIYNYTGIQSYASWVDIENRKEHVYVGLFAGYSKNLGTKEPISNRSWGRATNVSYMYRISPRAGLIYGKTTFNAEILYDVAAYGTPDTYFAFDDVSPADNVRVLLTVKYAF